MHAVLAPDRLEMHRKSSPSLSTTAILPLIPGLNSTWPPFHVTHDCKLTGDVQCAPSSMNPILQLASDIRLEYLAEGGANIAYRICSASQPHLAVFLLRLHKTVPWIPSYAELHYTQQSLISPLFASSQLVSQILVAVPRNVLRACNTELRAGESVPDHTAPLQENTTGFSRRQTRHGLYLAEDEPYGLLVTDMTADPTADQFALEFKPKWLLQSPNAPPGSKRCRTCALRAMRSSDKSPSSPRYQKPKTTYFCPLDLVSGDPTSIARAVSAILAAQKPTVKPLSAEDSSRVVNAVTDFLSRNELLTRLRSLQAKLDPDGILALAPDSKPSKDILIATTLRDCTLFVKVGMKAVDGGGVEGVFEARLGDLDVKAPEEGKVRQWRETEERLVDEGWYEGSGGPGGGECRLGREECVMDEGVTHGGREEEV